MKFRKLWVWTGDEYMFYQSKCVGSVLHVCSGRSEFGDVKVDRYQKADIRADYRFLPFKAKSFDTVICDPYWGKTEQINLGIINWLRELARVARKRIVIVHNTPFYVPEWKLVEAYAVQVKGLMGKVVHVFEPQVMRLGP